MTTFQDQQPQSRRAARQSERANPAEPAVGVYSDPSTPREMWDTTARRAAQLVPPPSTGDTPVQSAEGRRAAAPAQPAGEPLDYVTQQKAPIPTYDGPSFRPRGGTPPPESAELPPTQAMPIADRPAFRPRDFSPEGRRSTGGGAARSWTEPIDPAPNGASDLDYHTEARETPAPAAAPVSFLPPAVAPAPQAAPEPTEPPVSEIPADVAPERTLTRRELRAMQQAETAVPELQEPPVAPAPTAGPSTIAPIPTEPDAEQSWPFAGMAGSSSVSEETVPFSSLPEVAPEPAPTTGLTNAMNEFDSLAARRSASHDAPPVVDETPSWHEAAETAEDAERPEPAPWTPPRGHWSTQLEQDDPSQPHETTINRTVGGASLTTSALVLPAVPVGDISGPLSGTGEVMLTGSIDLPQSLAATGVSGRLEHEGIDRLFESHDAELVSTDSVPVSAIKAVSTQSGSNLAHAPKPKGTRALTALVISAASMGVVVVGLLIVALVMGVL